MDWMMNEDFSDVTLVTEDKKQIYANISVLRACSPVFRDTLKKEKNSSSIMYLRGIHFTEIELNQSCNSSILVKQHFTKKEWMNFLL